MPQLDPVIFFMEYIWLVFFLVVIYNIICLVFFPNLFIFLYVYKFLNDFLIKESLFISKVAKRSYLIFNIVLLKKEYIMNHRFICDYVNNFYLNCVKNSYFLYNNRKKVIKYFFNEDEIFFANILLSKWLELFLNLMRINGRV